MNSLKGMYGWTAKTLLSDERSRRASVLQEPSEENKNPLPDDDPAPEEESSNPEIHHLEKRLQATIAKNEKLTQEKDDLQRQLAQVTLKFNKLEQNLKDAHAENKDNIKRTNHHYISNWLPYIRKLEAKLEEVVAKNGTMERENRIYYTQLMKLQTEHAELKRHSDHAEESVKKCEQQILKLTETISRSGQRDEAKGATRDDDYFATEFSELANAVQQWVFRHFRGAGEDRLDAIDPLLQKLFEETVDQDEPLKKSRTQLDAIAAMVAHQLTVNVFPQFQFLGVAGLHDPFLTLFNCIEGTDLQRQMWRARTMDMVFKHETVLKAFDETVKTIAESLEKPFGTLAAKGSKGDQRNRALCGLVERTAKLAVEVAQQQSTIELYSVAPGEFFDGFVMEDAAGDAEEEEEQEEMAVRMQLFPAVLRSDYDSKGRESKSSVVILKAKVLARVS